MTDQSEERVASLSSFQEVWAVLVRVAGALAGATGLTFGVGFVLINLSLLKHGVYEGALVRERYVAAGISFLAALTGAVLIARAAYWLADRLPSRWPRALRILVAVVLTPALDYLLALLVWAGGRVSPELNGEMGVERLITLATWWLEGLRFFNVTLLIWAIAAGGVGLFLLYADRIQWAREALFRKALLPSPPSQPSEPSAAQPQAVGEAEEISIQIMSRAQSPAYLAALGIAFFILLLTYGQYVYETLPAALGGGLPVIIQFTGSEEQMTILAGMGIPLENPTTTDQIQLIGQTATRYIVRIRQTESERSPVSGKIRSVSRSTILALEKSLVQGIRYYPSEYYLSNTFAAIKHVQQGNSLYEQGFYDPAIEEYAAAIDRQPTYSPAYFYRGRAYLSKARIPWDQGDLETARREATKAVDDFELACELSPGEAEYWYFLALAQAMAGKPRAALENLSRSFERAPSYRDQAQEEPLLFPLRARADLDFGFEILVFGSEAEAARIYAAQGQDRYALSREARQMQARQSALEQASLAYSWAITLTADLPLEQAAYRVALANIRQDQGRSDLAMIELEQAVESAPQNEGYRLRLAQVYTSQGRWSDALAQYEAVLEQNPQNVTALLGKGEALLQQGGYRPAANAFQQASEVAPDEAAAWYGLGLARLAFAPGGAEAPLRQAVSLNPTLAITIASALRQAQVAADAQERLDAILQAAEEAAQGDTALEEGDLAQAAEHYKAAVETDPENATYLLKLGDVYRRQGDEGLVEAYAQAAEIYRRLIEQAGGEPSYYFRLATAYAAQGADSDALVAYNTAISLDPNMAAYYVARAAIYIRMGRTSDALSDYDTAIRLDSAVAAYYAGRATLYVQLNRTEEAIGDYERAVGLEPGNYLYRGQLGQLYYQMSAYEQAIAALTTATSLNPAYTLGYFYLGQTYLALGDTDAARVAFGTCVEVAQEEGRRHQCQEQLTPLVTPTP